MTLENEQLTRTEFNVCSLVVLIVCGLPFLFIWLCVPPIVCKDQINALSFLSTVLALLAGGSIAGFFSFEYINADSAKELKIVRKIGYLFIGGIFLLIFLSLYCLAKVGIFNILDTWVKVFLFLGTYAVLDGIVLLDRWDAKKRKFDPPTSADLNDEELISHAKITKGYKFTIEFLKKNRYHTR